MGEVSSMNDKIWCRRIIGVDTMLVKWMEGMDTVVDGLRLGERMNGVDTIDD
jgi:hypothetical protein